MADRIGGSGDATGEDDGIEPVRPPTLQEEAGVAPHQLGNPPQAEGDRATVGWAEASSPAEEEGLRSRSPEEVFDDHLRLAAEHRFEEDIRRNVSPDCVILERRGVFHGREGARELARLLEEELPDAPYVYTNRRVSGRFAFLEWTAEAAAARVRDGADSFVIEDGWIVAQTIHYTVETTRGGGA